MLRLHLQVDKLGVVKHLYVFDGDKLVGELAGVQKVDLSLYAPGQPKPRAVGLTLKISTPRGFELEVIDP